MEAWSPPAASAFAIVGDSITDGRSSWNNANARWTDELLERMKNRTSTRDIAVLNQAAGGNRVLHDRNGPNAQSRIERDVISQPGVKYAMIVEGVNDIGTAASTTEAQNAVVERLIAAYKQIVTRVHTFGIPIFAATIAPFGCMDSTVQDYSTPKRIASQQKVNHWIKTSGVFDAVVDFAEILADPTNETMMDPALNSGDCLHPNVKGYRRLASKFPLELFDEFKGGVDTYT